MFSIHNIIFYYYSLLYALPMTLFNLHRLRRPLPWHRYTPKLKTEDPPAAAATAVSDASSQAAVLQFKPGPGDYFYRFLLTLMFIYYIIDEFVLITAPWEDMDGCNFSYQFHHSVSIMGYFFLIRIPYYPWFLMGPFTMHAYLMAFPHEQWLNYIYLAIVIAFMYGLTRKPFYQLKPYKELFWCSLSLIGPLISLWAFNCKNTLEHS